MIKSVEISNFCGYTEAKFDCGKFNIFQGNNNQGKTSLLDAISWCITGGNDDGLVKNGTNTCEVILRSDKGTRIERRLTRGGQSKLYVYKDEEALSKPQEVLNKLYSSSLLFKPTKMLHMDSKELSKFINESIGKRLKLKPEQIKEYKLEELNLTEDPIDEIKKFHKQKYDARTEANRSLKTAKTKMSTANFVKVEPEDVAKLEVEVKELNDKITTIKDNNNKIEIGNKNKVARETTKNRIDELKKEIGDNEVVAVEDLEKELETYESKQSKLKAGLTLDREKVKVLRDSLEKLKDGQVKCPIHPSVTCITDMKQYSDNMKTEIDAIISAGKENFITSETLAATIEVLKERINTSKNIKQKSLELSRAESMYKQFEIYDGEVEDVTALVTEHNEKSEKLAKMKVFLELSKISNVEDLEKRCNELNDHVKKLDELITDIIPTMLNINIKNIKVTQDGIFYLDHPLERQGSGMKLRLTIAILKDLFPKSNLFNLDKMECLCMTDLIKFVNHFSQEDNDIQYFGTHVDSVDLKSTNKLKIFNVNNFTLSEV